MRRLLVLSSAFLLYPTLAIANEPTYVVPAPVATAAATPIVQASPSAAPDTVLVPAGTEIPIHIIGQLNSGSAHADDVFEAKAANDVVVNGRIAIRKGAHAQGHIVSSDGAGGNGHSGSVSLAFDWIYAADGNKIRLADSTQSQIEEDRKGASSTATIVGYATLGLGGLFAHNFAHGRQKVIDEKTMLTAFTAQNAHVVATETPEPYDH